MATLIKGHNEARPSEALPHARLHDLRHVHATTLLLAGVPVHVVAARLGHADPSITLRVHAITRDQQSALRSCGHLRAGYASRQLAPVSRSVSNEGPAGTGGGLTLDALGGTRTPNLLIRSQMLYPLSYERLMPG